MNITGTLFYLYMPKRKSFSSGATLENAIPKISLIVFLFNIPTQQPAKFNDLNRTKVRIKRKNGAIVRCLLCLLKMNGPSTRNSNANQFDAPISKWDSMWLINFDFLLLSVIVTRTPDTALHLVSEPVFCSTLYLFAHWILNKNVSANNVLVSRIVNEHLNVCKV